MTSSQQTLLTIAILASIIAIVNSENIFRGAPKPGDGMIFSTDVRQTGAMLEIVRRTMTFEGPEKQEISQVKIIDLNRERGHGGKAEILRGGEGKKSVTIRFAGDRGYSIDYRIQLMGALHPNTTKKRPSAKHSA